MNEKDKLLIFLSYFEISIKKQEQLLEALQSFSIDEVLNSACLLDILSADEYHKLVASYDKARFESALQNMQSHNIKFLTIFSEDYPQKLRDLPDRPLVLYAKGDLSLFNEPSIAIVGTRMPSNYGKVVADKFSTVLAESGFVVISGLCYGVDEIAHRKTLDVGGKTIAVVGSGFQNIYPAQNTALAEEIAEKGLLLSEYPPSFKPKRYTFPKRNRIVAGLCDGVLIPEAGMKSGTIHTKEFALEYGKDIFAVPGNINSSKSELTNHMIKYAQAECVLSPEDIVDFYGMKKKSNAKKMVSLNFDEQTIVNLLSVGEQNFDDLAQKSKISVNILNSCLTTLEIRGLIRKLPGQIYALT